MTPRKKTKTPKKAKTTRAANKAPKPPIQPNTKRGRGRPSEYKPEYAELIGNMYLLGMTDQEVADHMEVSTQTLYNWQRKYPELLDAGKYKAVADAEVLAAARRKATGYTCETEKIIGKGDNAKVVKVKVHVPGDATAQQFWLRNRRRKEWGDTKQVEIGSPGDFDHLSADELREQIAKEEMELAAMGLIYSNAGSDSIN